MNSITLTLTSGIVGILLGALISAVVSAYLYRKYDKLKQKRDVLTRLVGNRHFLTDPENPNDTEPFISLNEICIVFAGSPSVIAAVKENASGT